MSNLNHHVLAAYYNDARLNILSCLNDIREKTGQKPILDEAQILSAFSTLSLTNTTPERQRDLIKHLRNRFHFVDVLTESGPQKNKVKDAATPNPADYELMLKWLFKLINDLRNTMVHPVDQEAIIDRRIHKHLFFALNKIYDGGLRTVKTRFDLDTKTIEPLLRCDRKGQSKTMANFSFALCTDPKSIENETATKQSQVLYDFGHILLCSLFLDKSQSAELISYFWKAGYASRWTDQQKNIIKELISIYRIRLPIQRLKSDDTPTAVTLDTLSELSRCPRFLLDSLSPKDQERFRGGLSLMSARDNGENGDNDPSYLFARGYQDRFIPLMMHFLDFDPDSKLRFAIDFGQFYYNVRLKPADRFTDGHSRVRRLGQKIVGYGRLTDFEILEKPKAWQELEKNYTDFIEQQETLACQTSDAIEQLNPYIVKSFPHYHYYDDKIGFRLAQTGEPAAYPDLHLQDLQSNSCLNAVAGKEMAPEFWISPSQMLHIGFYAYLQKTQIGHPSLDILLGIYRGGMANLLKVLANGGPSLTGEPFSDERRQEGQQWIDSFFGHHNGPQFSIKLADLPDVVMHHLIGSACRQLTADEIVARAEHLLNETEHKQKQIDSLLQQPKKRGQQGFKPIKCGHIGDFLADDLMRFQPVDRRKADGGKLNSQHYQILQAALAYYGAHLDEPPKIVDLLNDARLLKGDFAHPFLSRLNLEKNPDQYAGLISFYKAYLQARKQFLNEFINKTKQHANTSSAPNWLRLKQRSSLNSWLAEYKDEDGKITATKMQPLPVPKNMLYQPILVMVAKEVGVTPEDLHLEGVQNFTRQGQSTEVRPAISWLIRRYLEHKNDSAQIMYQYPRRHDLFDTYLDKRGPKQRFQEQQAHYLAEQQRKDYLEPIRKFINNQENGQKNAEKKEKLTKQLKYYKRQEKQIRHCATKDMLLYLFAKNHLHTLQLSGTESSPTWPLNSIENTLLNTAIHYQLAVPKTDKTLFHPECKIRNLGELRLLVRDKRLPSLMNYYPQHEKIIHQAEISAELVSYRRAKVKAMALVHELENEIMQNCETIEKNSVPAEFKHAFGEGRHGEFLYALYQLSRTQNRQNQPDSFDMSCFNKARLLRNALSHNEYPETGAFAHITQSVNLDKIPENPAKHRKIAEKLLAEMERLYKPWLIFLKQSIKEH